ncbi:hypothetical protein [Chlorogloeopsis sp. ULAP02]|uniref:hypothetical protein n=1 Tax=Chlorogloeopsis sp. ULAP02 TaxID=3107926 RepID=UPI0031359D9D
MQSSDTLTQTSRNSMIDKPLKQIGFLLEDMSICSDRIYSRLYADISIRLSTVKY